MTHRAANDPYAVECLTQHIHTLAGWVPDPIHVRHIAGDHCYRVPIARQALRHFTQIGLGAADKRRVTCADMQYVHRLPRITGFSLGTRDHASS